MSFNFNFGALALLLISSLLVGAVAVARHPVPRPTAGFGKRETLPLRGLLAVLVMLGHFDYCAWPSGTPLHKWTWATPAVAVFFFLSGYGLWKSHAVAESEGRLPAYWSAFPVRSFKRLFIPALAVIVPTILVLVAVGGLPSFPVMPRRLAAGSVGWIVPHGWFVFALALMYCAYAVSFRLAGKKNGIALVAVFVLLYWVVTKHVLCWKPCWWQSIFSFPLGLVFSKYEDWIRRAFAAHPIAVAGLAAVVLALPFVMQFAFGERQLWMREAFLTTMGPAVALCLMSSDVLTRMKPLNALGTCSYELYLVHGIVQLVWFPSGLDSLVSILVAVSASLALAVLFHSLLAARK